VVSDRNITSNIAKSRSNQGNQASEIWKSGKSAGRKSEEMKAEPTLTVDIRHPIFKMREEENFRTFTLF
jgi:hypothetical protein